MNKKVITRLGYTPEKYESFLMTLWLQWCHAKTNDRRGLQKALTCRPLYNWWLREVAALEKNFLYETELHSMDLDESTIHAVYISHIRRIHALLSKPLLKRAERKTTIYGNN